MSVAEELDLSSPGVVEMALFSSEVPEIRADPYPLYARMRAADPVHRTPFGAWLLLRYDDAVAVLRDSRFSVDHRNARTEGGGIPGSAGPGERGLDNVMLFMDPPDHTRLRTLVNKAFTPRAIEALRHRIHEVVDELLDAVEGRGEMDVIADFAYPLPVTVIMEMLGIPLADRAKFKEWSRDVAPILDPIVSPATAERIVGASVQLEDYFNRLLADRRQDPGPDLVSELIRAEDEGDRLNEDELRATCILLLIAGHETTMNLIGNGLLALLRHPYQIRSLRDNPDLVRPAIEELLRYDGPVHLTARTALADVELSGHTMSKGEMAVVCIGSANRDPEHFTDPDDVDVTRNPNRHIAFSAGPHFCVGATLARLEGQIAISTLLQRAPGLSLAGEPEWRDTITLRGLKALPVAI